MKIKEKKIEEIKQKNERIQLKKENDKKTKEFSKKKLLNAILNEVNQIKLMKNVCSFIKIKSKK